MPDAARDERIEFECATPILRVENLSASLDYYTRILGFQIDWQEPGVMASVSRGRAVIMLCAGAQGAPGTWIWVGVSDAESLHNAYRQAGALIRLPPTNYPWALEFHVQVPDSHVLRFGSEPKTDQPFSEWVDWYRNDT